MRERETGREYEEAYDALILSTGASPLKPPNCSPSLSAPAFDVEIIARFIRRRGYDMASIERSIYEFPLPEWRDVAGSRVRPRDFFRAFFDVLQIYRRNRP